MSSVNKSTVIAALILALLAGFLWYMEGGKTLQVSNEDSTGPIFSIATSTGQTYVTVTADGKVGIGTENPFALFEVAGPIRLTQKSTDGCSPMTEGEIAYNPDNHHFWGCNGNAWRQLDTQ